MTTGLPFTPLQASTTAGAGVKVTANNTPTSVPGTVTNTSNRQANNMMVTNTGTVMVFVRLSAEATPVATAADIPIPPGTFRILQNPVPAGACGVAALSITTTAADVYFTPGEGGT